MTKEPPLREGDRVATLVQGAPQEMKILWFGHGDQVRCSWIDQNGIEQEQSYSILSLWKVPDGRS